MPPANVEVPVPTDNMRPGVEEPMPTYPFALIIKCGVEVPVSPTRNTGWVPACCSKAKSAPFHGVVVPSQRSEYPMIFPVACMVELAYILALDVVAKMSPIL